MFPTLLAYFLFGVTSTILLSILGAFVYSFRHHRSVTSFLVVIGGIAVVCCSDFLELLGPDERWCVYWAVPVRTTAVCVVVASWFHFCLVYTNLDIQKWARSATMIAIAGATALSAITWTPWRPVLFRELKFVQHEWLWEPLERVPGPLFDLYLAFAILCTMIGLLVLSIYLYRTSLHGRTQVLLLVLGFGLPIGVESLNAMELLGSPAIDKLVFVLPVTLVLLTLALYRYGLLLSTPIFLRGLMDSLPDAVVALDHANYVSEVNARGLRFLRRHASETRTDSPILNRKPADILRQGHPVLQVFEQLVPGEQTVQTADPNGRQTFVVRTTAFRNTQTATLVNIRDETERYRLLEDLDAYATTVAHDLRSPLAAIVINCDVLIQAKGSSDRFPPIDVQQERKLLEQILKSSSRMKAIINDLLHVGGMHRTKPPEIVEIDTLELVNEVVRRFAVEDGVFVELVAKEPVAAVLGQPVWMDMILTNLISNAAEHGSDEAAGIELRIESAGDFQKFAVVNNGRRLEHDPFAVPTLSHESDDSVGKGPSQPRGFGLSIVRRLVERQGGTVGVESGEDETEFWFTLHKVNPRNESE